MTDLRVSPRTSARCGPFTLVWLDLWLNCYGLAFEVNLGSRRIYVAAVGFGQGVQFRRDWR